MRFISYYQTATYVVKPGYKQVVNGTPIPVKAIRAKFSNHLFDSEKAQREYNWTDEERDLVEQTLLNHADFEIGKIRPAGDSPDQMAEYAKVVDSKASAKARCIATFDTPEGSEPCGRSVVGDSDYCGEHIQSAAVA